MGANVEGEGLIVLGLIGVVEEDRLLLLDGHFVGCSGHILIESKHGVQSQLLLD